MDITIREEQECEYLETEYVVKKAFWNLHVPGCSEHYLVHKLRKDDAYIPEISRIAEVDGKVVGTIMYSHSYVEGDGGRTPVIIFGPLCVEPEYQKKGIGDSLLKETMALAKSKGYKAIIIFGEPEYYPRFGFLPCEHFGITTADGKNFPAFMGIELVEGALKNVKGKFYEAEIFHNLPPEAVEEYDKKFPYMEKLKLPGQWE